MFAISNRISFNSRINTLKFCLKLTPINSNHSNKLRIQLRSINIAGESAVKSSSQYQKPRSPVGYLFALLPVATFCLGTWQIYRLRWKLDLIAKLESIINNDPVDFPDQLDMINDMEYVKVKIQGHIDRLSAPQFIFPRSIIQRDESTNQGSLISKGSGQGLGAQLVLPFVITDKRFDMNPLRILVNFGWITREKMDKINLILKNHKVHLSPQEEFELIGVIRKTEKREPFTAKQEYTQGYWTRRDIEKMSEKLETTPIYLDAFETHPLKLICENGDHEQRQFDVSPIGGQTRINLRNEHLSYIITWYSLTGIFSYLWYKKIFKSRL
ncbi:surfeit 1-like protein [Dermatophagoides farinae]|uniref:SURF1-like protein n=1 Tax=Dermatophagoides farinae TaxID=6954 RepID=A0A9D4SCW1_DERFA|nr:surfeit locus protein 1-like [Dermatophagoides farinae]KAH7636430.1 surfeit 1-like protein [Dermatophagoides farinae]